MIFGFPIYQGVIFNIESILTIYSIKSTYLCTYGKFIFFKQVESIQVENPTPLQCRMGSKLEDIGSIGSQSFENAMNEQENFTDSFELSPENLMIVLNLF